MRFFTLQEAERLLPEIEHHLRDALFHKAEYEQAQKEVNRTAQRVRLAGGVRLDPARVQAVRARLDTSVAGLKNALEEISQAGVLVKDLDIGLIDFMTQYHGQAVCLCWKLGEEGIRYWHGETEGFRGRKPIDDEFIRNHRGEQPAPAS